MIDTVALTLMADEFSITDHDKFHPSTRGLFEYNGYPLNKGSFKCVQNPTKKDFLNGIYRPRLTVTKRLLKGACSITLRIEFSAPKLVFGNNFEELDDSDFKFVTRHLTMLLGEMGVRVSLQTILKASVSAIHFSKNILLEHTFCLTAIAEIARSEPFTQMDSNHTNYRNGGYSYKIHSNSFELVFYDKVKDLEKAKISEKRAIEKENAIQLNLFEPLQERKMKVLRIEARCGNKKKIRHVLEKINISNKELCFEQLCNKAISQKILLFFIAEIEKKLFIDKISIDSNDLFQTFSELLFYNDRKQKDTMLRLFALILLIKEQGVEKTRNLLNYRGKKGNQKWYRDMKAIKKLEKAKEIQIPILREIERSLLAFSSIRLDNLPEFDFIKSLKESRFQYIKPKNIHKKL